MQLPTRPKKRTPWKLDDDRMRPLYEAAFGPVRKRPVKVSQRDLADLLLDHSALCAQLGE